MNKLELHHKIKFLEEFKQKVMKVENKDYKIAHEISALISSLQTLMRDLEDNNEPLSKAHKGMDIGDEHHGGWFNSIFKHINEIFTTTGISSLTDAVVISNALISLEDRLPDHQVFFRGEHKIGYPLLSSIGRTQTENTFSNEEYSNITKVELNAIKQFQDDCLSGVIELKEEDKEKVKNLDKNSSMWLILMQHYDNNGNGTRLLDITPSIFIALYFACVKWDGSIDEEEDGILYLLDPRWLRVRHIRAYSDKTMPWEEIESITIDDFFEITDDTLDVSRVLSTNQKNERLKAQNGHFIWHPKFNLPLEQGLFYMRVNKEAKKIIAKELLIFGINPRELIQGSDGEEAYGNLMMALYGRKNFD